MEERLEELGVRWKGTPERSLHEGDVSFGSFALELGRVECDGGGTEGAARRSTEGEGNDFGIHGGGAEEVEGVGFDGEGVEEEVAEGLANRSAMDAGDEEAEVVDGSCMMREKSVYSG